MARIVTPEMHVEAGRLSEQADTINSWHWTGDPDDYLENHPFTDGAWVLECKAAHVLAGRVVTFNDLRRAAADCIGAGA